VTETTSTEEPTPAEGAPAKRRKGRPKRADAPVVPWLEVDRLLVHGEKVEGGEPGARRFPSFKELGTRYGVSQTRIWQYAHSHKCMERRKEAALRELVRYDQHVAARRADVRALAAEDIVAVVDEFIRGFKQAMDEGKIRFDSPADLDKMVRLRQLVTGGPDARTELTGTLTLEAIQQRHRLLRGQVESSPLELTGTAAPRTNGDEADGVVEDPERRAVPADAAPAADEAVAGSVGPGPAAPGPAEDHARRVLESGGPVTDEAVAGSVGPGPAAPGPAEDHARRVLESGGPVNGVAPEPAAPEGDRPLAHDDRPPWLAGMANDDDDDLVPGLANLGGELEFAGGEEA
jgi:hypothetical protein